MVSSWEKHRYLCGSWKWFNQFKNSPLSAVGWFLFSNRRQISMWSMQAISLQRQDHLKFLKCVGSIIFHFLRSTLPSFIPLLLQRKKPHRLTYDLCWPQSDQSVATLRKTKEYVCSLSWCLGLNNREQTQSSDHLRSHISAAAENDSSGNKALKGKRCECLQDKLIQLKFKFKNRSSLHDWFRNCVDTSKAVREGRCGCLLCNHHTKNVLLGNKLVTAKQIHSFLSGDNQRCRVQAVLKKRENQIP